jgi:hypothetical protein
MYLYLLIRVWRIPSINLLGVDLCLVSALWLRLRIYDNNPESPLLEPDSEQLRISYRAKSDMKQKNDIQSGK